jgi:hypothetical protein
MSQAVLLSRRIRLVPLAEEHLEFEVRLDSDPEVMRYPAVDTASRATMAAVGMVRVRTFHRDLDEPVPGSELGEVEYAITRAQWLAG